MKLFDVTDYGAVGNHGAINDSAIAAALAAMGPYGGELYFPPGIYDYIGEIKITGSNIYVTGSNATLYGRRTTATTPSGMSLEATASNITVSGLIFDSNGYADWQANDCVTHNGVNYYLLQNHTSGATTEPGVGVIWQNYWLAGGPGGSIWITGKAYASHRCTDLDGTASTSNEAYLTVRGATNVLIENNTFLGMGCWNLPLLDGASYIGIRNNTFRNSAADGINIYDGANHVAVTGNIMDNLNDDAVSMVYNSTDTLGPPNRVLSAKNIIINSKTGFTSYGGIKALVTGNYIDSAFSRGIGVANWDRKLTIGLTANYSSDIDIIGNYILNTGVPSSNDWVSGLYISELSRGYVANNTIVNSARSGAMINNSSDLTLASNMIIQPVDEGLQTKTDAKDKVTSKLTLLTKTDATDKVTSKLTLLNNTVDTASTFGIHLFGNGTTIYWRFIRNPSKW